MGTNNLITNDSLCSYLRLLRLISLYVVSSCILISSLVYHFGIFLLCIKPEISNIWPVVLLYLGHWALGRLLESGGRARGHGLLQISRPLGLDGQGQGRRSSEGCADNSFCLPCCCLALLLLPYPPQLPPNSRHH